jgi:hypothetical protein
LRLQCQSAGAENSRLHARGERVQQQAGEAVAAWQRRLGEAQELESEYRLLQEKHRDLIERSSNPLRHYPLPFAFLSLPRLPPLLTHTRVFTGTTRMVRHGRWRRRRWLSSVGRRRTYRGDAR